MSNQLSNASRTGDEAKDALFERMSTRLDTLLPPMYRESYETVAPVSMGSAGLRFAADGRVAWNEMWGSFCNLAMAGGPPHKGRLLESSPKADVEAHPARYAEVIAEIVRGIESVTGMGASPTSSGWVRMHCPNSAMAGWMLRAIVMENVSVRGMGTDLELPAGPAFRLEKEIKNVITVSAKAAHYWQDHMPRAAQIAVAQLLMKMEAEQPLLAPALASGLGGEDALRSRIAKEIGHSAGLREGGPVYSGWSGFECGSSEKAIALMRLVLVSNVLARREETVLYIPLNAALDPQGFQAAEAVRRAQTFLAQKAGDQF